MACVDNARCLCRKVWLYMFRYGRLSSVQWLCVDAESSHHYPLALNPGMRWHSRSDAKHHDDTSLEMEMCKPRTQDLAVRFISGSQLGMGVRPDILGLGRRAL